MNDSSTNAGAGTAPGLAADGEIGELCTVPRAARDRFGLLLVCLGQRLDQMADDPLLEMGLDGHDYMILSILVADDPGSQGEIAQLLGKAPGVVVAAVDQLEAKGLVERRRDPADRRRTRVTPTDAGLAALRRADALADQIVAEVLPGLTAAERGEAHGLLRRGLGL